MSNPATTLPNEHATVPKAVRSIIGHNGARSRLEAEAAQQARSADIGYVRRWVDTTRASMILRIINWLLAIAMIIFGALWYFKYHPVPRVVFRHERWYYLAYATYVFLTSLVPLSVVGYSHPKKRRAMWIAWAIADAIAATLGLGLLYYILNAHSQPQEYNMAGYYKTAIVSGLSAANMILDSIQANRLLKY